LQISLRGAASGSGWAASSSQSGSTPSSGWAAGLDLLGVGVDLLGVGLGWRGISVTADARAIEVHRGVEHGRVDLCTRIGPHGRVDHLEGLARHRHVGAAGKTSRQAAGEAQGHEQLAVSHLQHSLGCSQPVRNEGLLGNKPLVFPQTAYPLEVRGSSQNKGV
jgi:hypothetical protein